MHRAIGAIGVGPERAVFREAISSRLEDRSRWSDRTDGGYAQPIFTTLLGGIVRSRTTAFYVDGTLAALHMGFLGVGPEPMSPWIVYAATQQDWNGMDLSLDFIRALDSSKATLLEPWFDFPQDVVLSFPQDFHHPVVQLAGHYLSLSVCFHH